MLPATAKMPNKTKKPALVITKIMFIANDSSKQSYEIQAIEANDMKMFFYSVVNKTLFRDDGFALRLVFKVRVFGLGNDLFFAHESEFAVTQPFYIIVVQGRSRFAGKQRMKGFLLDIT